MTIYTAPNDHAFANFSGVHTPLLWANVSKMRGGDWLNVTPEDIAILAACARDGCKTYPVWGGSIAIPANTAVCLDTDTFFELHADILGWQSWSTDRVADLYKAFKATAPHVPLTSYYIGVWPISDRMIAPYFTAADYAAQRQARHLERINRYLDFVCIRCPLFAGDIVPGYKWLDAAIDFMPHAVETVRKENPGKQVLMWLRDDFNGNAPTETYQRYARAAMVDSKSDGAVIWGTADGQIPKLLAACQSFLPSTRPPVRGGRPATRGAVA